MASGSADIAKALEKHNIIDETKREYQTKGQKAWERAWQILNTSSGWKDAAGTDLRQTGKVYSQHFADIGRVFKLEGTIPLAPERLFEEVVLKVEQNPKWNPTVLESKIVERVDDNTDICHNITAEAAGGLVSSRDFVSVRHWETRNGVILSAGCGVPHPDCPPSKNYVRGEQKPGGWSFQPAKDGSDDCHFCWVVASDLKGWIPQVALDRAVPGILLDFMEKLKAFADFILAEESRGVLREMS